MDVDADAIEEMELEEPAPAARRPQRRRARARAEGDSAIATLRSGVFGCGLLAYVMRSISPVMGLTWGIICTRTRAHSAVLVHYRAVRFC